MHLYSDTKDIIGHKVFTFLTRNTSINSCCNTLCKSLKAIVKKGIIVKYTNNNTYSGTK